MTIETRPRMTFEDYLIDPNQQAVMVLTLTGDTYQEAIFKASERIVSPTFSGLYLTAEQVLNPQE